MFRLWNQSRVDVFNTQQFILNYQELFHTYSDLFVIKHDLS